MRALLLAAPFALAACAQEPVPEPIEEEAAPVTSALRTLVPAGLNDQELGPRIVGPQGPEVEDTLMFEGRAIATMISSVSCPAPEEGAQPLEECDPAAQAEGAIFTYVHTITSGEGVEQAITSFRTAMPATGFANVIGFDRDQAEAALGEGYAIGTQTEDGALIWRIEEGDGWQAGETITLFWQGTLPPAGPAAAYEIETAEGRAKARGPFPPENMPEDSPVEDEADR